jgi:transcriptional regulator NrdR family protein
MRCPYCDSENYKTLWKSKRHRRKAHAGAFIRCHECLECHSKFISRQEPLDAEQAADLLEEMAQ